MMIKLILVLFFTLIKAKAPYGMWLWQDDISTNATERAKLFAFLDTTPVNTLFWEKYVSDDVPSFLAEAHSRPQPLEVSMLFGFAASSGSIPVQEIKTWVDDVLSLTKTLRASGATSPSGIHFDIEPKITQQYIEYAQLLSDVRSKLDTSGLKNFPLSIASSWGYQQQMIQCPNIHSSGVIVSPVDMMTCIYRFVDINILMDFRNYAILNGDGMVGKGNNTVMLALAAGKKVAFGAETNCDVGKYTYKLSYCNHTREYMDAQFGIVQKAFQDAGVWDTFYQAPFVIEEWHGYSAMKASEV